VAAGVHSGWIGPDGRVEQAPGTGIHVELLARFGETTKAGFFAKGAVRYVAATDHVSLELMGQHPIALGNAIEALTRRWAHQADVDVELLSPPEVLRASSAEVRQALGRRLRILLVDDDPMLIKSLQDTLQEDGHVITATHGGQAGIDAFAAAQKNGESLDIVITDLGMPYVDGRKVAASIKTLSPKTPVILLTGWGQRLIAANDVPAHVDKLLSKPPRLSELRAALSELVP